MGITTTQTKMKIWTRIHTHKEKKKKNNNKRFKRLLICSHKNCYWNRGETNRERESAGRDFCLSTVFFFFFTVHTNWWKLFCFSSPLLQNVYLKNENFRERGGQPNASRAICPELFSFLFFFFWALQGFSSNDVTWIDGGFCLSGGI